MLTLNGLIYTSPALLGDERPNPRREFEVLGAAVWLWIQSRAQGGYKQHKSTHLLLPAIRSGQYILCSEAGKSVFFMTWANLSQEAEIRYMQHASAGLRAADWISGDRKWIIDWIDPFGHSLHIQNALRQQLWHGDQARSLYHLDDELIERVTNEYDGSRLEAV